MIDENIKRESIDYVKKNIKLFIEKFADLKAYPPVENPFSIFMAGSPGAGKTEFSTSFDPRIMEYEKEVPIVRIDADEIKKHILQYNGKNTDSVQYAATIVADKLFDFVQDNDQNVIVDATFANYYKSSQNIERAIKRKRKIGIVYIHQDPIIAWGFTKVRELSEGRPIPKDFFIESYFLAKDNVNKIKELYGKEVKLILVEKNFKNQTAKTHINIDKIDNYLKFKYNKEELNRLLQQ